MKYPNWTEVNKLNRTKSRTLSVLECRKYGGRIYECCLPSLSDALQEAASRPPSSSLRCMPSNSHPQSFRSCRFHIFSIWEPVNVFCISITSFDLATRLSIRYLISLYDVATSTSSQIRECDNAVLIGTGSLGLIRKLTACRAGRALRKHKGPMHQKSVYFWWSCQFNWWNVCAKAIKEPKQKLQ